MQMARFLDMLDEKRVKRPNVRECALILQKHSKSDYPVEVHFLTFGLCAKISHLSPFSSSMKKNLAILTTVIWYKE